MPALWSSTDLLPLTMRPESYDRDRFDKPIGHWPMHTAIVRSLGRGLKWFDIGDIPTEGTASAKEYNIGQFKKGFVTEIGAWINWTRTGSVKYVDEERENCVDIAFSTPRGELHEGLELNGPS